MISFPGHADVIWPEGLKKCKPKGSAALIIAYQEEGLRAQTDRQAYKLKPGDKIGLTKPRDSSLMHAIFNFSSTSKIDYLPAHPWGETMRETILPDGALSMGGEFEGTLVTREGAGACVSVFMMKDEDEY